ncbi:SIMPL domain-containing protein [Natronorarus salvus]|uniref:SIMPL domain-containing protein n=1 Tax=Natronorarus salvus TaxID=3117733 RepID=UPI002F264A3E
MSDGREITVDTSASVETDADAAELVLAVETVEDTPEADRETVAAGVKRLDETFADLGLDEDRIHTTHFQMREDHRRSGDEERRFRGSHGFEVELHDLARIGEVIDATTVGLVGMNQIRFTLRRETRETMREEALRRSVASARSDARVLAESADLTLGGILALSTASGDLRPYQVSGRDVVLDTAKDESERTRVESGPVTVSAHVTAVFDSAGP